jgi:glycine cleavage system H lipoate-binding protein
MVFILVIISLFVLVMLDIFIFNRKTAKVAAKANALNASCQVFNLHDAELPKDYYFSKGHSWIKVENPEKVEIGLDGFLLNALGKIRLFNFAEPGKKLSKGDIMFETEVNNVKLKFHSPVEGIVTATKSDDNLSKDDWCLKVKPLNLKDNIQTLIPSDKAHKWIKSEFKRLKDLLYYSMDTNSLAGATMYDGGNIVEGAVSYIDKDRIKDFEELFLRVQ